jgi:hypothetical protein
MKGQRLRLEADQHDRNASVILSASNPATVEQFQKLWKTAD